MSVSEKIITIIIINNKNLKVTTHLKQWHHQVPLPIKKIIVSNAWFGFFLSLFFHLYNLTVTVEGCQEPWGLMPELRHIKGTPSMCAIWPACPASSAALSKLQTCSNAASNANLPVANCFLTSISSISWWKWWALQCMAKNTWCRPLGFKEPGSLIDPLQ